MNSKIKNVITAAMLAALCCVATMIIKIPSPLGGYLNAGDCIVLLSGYVFTPVYAFLAAGIGSALADVFSGYIIYAPATFVIKGIMALIAHFLFKALSKKCANAFARLVGGAFAELFMVLGYFVFEGIFLYGFIASAVNIIPNLLQGVAGLVLGSVLAGIFEKYKIVF